MVLHVDQAGGLVRPLEQTAELIEVPTLVAIEGALRDAGMALAALLDGAAEARNAFFRDVLGPQGTHAIVEGVEVDPHLGRDQWA